MTLIGYQILDSEDNVIQEFTSSPGQVPQQPQILVLPGLIQVHNPELDETYEGYRLVALESDDPVQPEISLHNIAAARLEVVEFEITGFERSWGILGGYMQDIDWAVVYFSEEQPDTDYSVLPSEGITKYTDRVEIQRTGLAALSFLVQRVY